MPSPTFSSREFSLANLDSILSQLRHELGNPLNSLKITLEVLTQNYRHFDDDKRRAFLERALEQVGRQQKFLDAMKTYYKSNIFDIRPIPLSAVWNAFVHRARMTVLEKQIEFKQVLENPDMWGLVDGAAFNRVLELVLDNAVDAVGNTEGACIEAVADRSNDHIKVTILDNGCGVEFDFLHKVFTPLFTTKEGKTGLGLSVCQRLMDKMNGWIEISSRPDQGTEVVLWAPLAGEEMVPNASILLPESGQSQSGISDETRPDRY